MRGLNSRDMNKIDAIDILIKISDECKNAGKCNKCAFYNLAGHIEGCVFNELANEINPRDFKQALRVK